LSIKFTPLGRVPVSDTDDVGKPVVWTVKVPAAPVVKVVELPLVMAGALFGGLTVSVKLWVAFGEIPLAAVMVIGYEPTLLVVPDRVAVPSPLLTKLTPEGSEPVSDRLAVGAPVDCTVKDPLTPWTKTAELRLVMAGGVPTCNVVTDSAVPRLVPRAV
jgi:hypothetical protein